MWMTDRITTLYACFYIIIYLLFRNKVRYIDFITKYFINNLIGDADQIEFKNDLYNFKTKKVQINIANNKFTIYYY